MAKWISPKKPCEWNGIHYKSRGDCARALGISRTTLISRLAKGYKSDADMTWIKSNADITGIMIVPKSKSPCEWNGVHYKSRTDCARALGITPAALSWRLRRGYKSDDDMPGAIAVNGCAIVYEGATYPSIVALAKHLGLHILTVRKVTDRLAKDNYTKADFSHIKPRPFIKRQTYQDFVLDGVTYPTIKAAAEALGVTGRTVINRIKKEGNNGQ